MNRHDQSPRGLNALEKLLFIIHVIASYIAWVMITITMYDKIKNKLVYSCFPVILYSLPSLLNQISDVFKASGLICLLLALTLNISRNGGRDLLETVFIPSPVIINLVYYILAAI
ncbi:MAG: hypothetical protein QXU13_06515 [Desulfurococcaceae archaeon]